MIDVVEENEIISRNIKAVRAQRGYTQGQMANMLNVSVPTYIKMENQPIELKLVKIKMLAKVLKCSVSDFLVENMFTSCFEKKY